MLTASPALPHPRGALSLAIIDTLRRPAGPAPGVRCLAEESVREVSWCLEDEDLQLSLTLLYELHYRGWADVDEAWEWNADLVVAAALLEGRLEADLRTLVARWLPPSPPAARQVSAALVSIAQAEYGPSLSSYLARQADLEEWREFLMHRSAYHLREADPHTWAIPRLSGAAKAALVEIQSDEYGGGRPEWMHAALFAQTMRGLGLSDQYAAHLDVLPAVTLAWSNTMTLFGLHRRLRGALVGHLAALEMTSSLPNKRYASGIRRLGLDDPTSLFFDEHVEADAVHEQIACHDLAGRLAQDEPRLAGDILFGAAAALATDGLVAEHLLSRWKQGESSLREPSLSAAR